MKETVLWRLIKQHIPGHIQRVENLVSPGAPDINACWNGHETWVELKVAKGNYVYFRDAQIAWFAKRIQQGGKAVIVIRKDDLIYVVQATELLKVTHEILPAGDKSCKIKLEHLSGYVCGKPYPWQTITEKVYSSPISEI